MTESVAVLIPVKGFGAAKERLVGTLDDEARADLARRMAEVVMDAAAPLPVTVACDDDEVEAWARSRGADVVRPDRPGLNHAVEVGVAALAERGVDTVVVAHADLPRATRLDHCAAFDGIGPQPSSATRSSGPSTSQAKSGSKRLRHGRPSRSASATWAANEPGP